MAKGDRSLDVQDREVREMRNAETVLGIIRRARREDDRRLWTSIRAFDPELYLNSYGRLYRNDGAMTKGVTAETVDGMSLGKIDGIIEQIRMNVIDGPLCVGLTSRNKDGRTRPLGIPNWSDKLLQDVIRAILKRMTNRSSPTSPTASAPVVAATPPCSVIKRRCGTGLKMVHRG